MTLLYISGLVATFAHMKQSHDVLCLSLVQIVLNANEVQLGGLPVSQPIMTGRLWDEVYEVCACESGGLYLVPAAVAMRDGCRADGGICGT